MEVCAGEERVEDSPPGDEQGGEEEKKSVVTFPEEGQWIHC